MHKANIEEVHGRVLTDLGKCDILINGDRKDGKRFSSYASDSDIADWIS